MIGISTRLFDLNGSVLILKSNLSDIPGLSRRVSKTATLDGNNSVQDFGLSEADGDWVIRFNDRLVISKLEYIITNHSQVIITSKRGVFIGTISELDTRSEPVELTFLAERKIS